MAPTLPTLSSYTTLNRKLPPAIEAIRMDWITSGQNAAVVSAMLASVASQLLSSFSVSTSDSDSSAPARALAVFSYCSLLFSCSATVTSLILVDEFGELPLRYARIEKPVEDTQMIAESTVHLLARVGARPHWTWVMYHWFFCLIAGILCLIVQVLIFVWLHETLGIRIFLLVVGVFSILPLLYLYPRRRRA